MVCSVHKNDAGHHPTRLAETRHASHSEAKHEILDCASLNRTLPDVSLVVENRKPFDFPVERPFSKNGRGGRLAKGEQNSNFTRRRRAPTSPRVFS
jgi:hypothetical protein